MCRISRTRAWSFAASFVLSRSDSISSCWMISLGCLRGCDARPSACARSLGCSHTMGPCKAAAGRAVCNSTTVQHRTSRYTAATTRIKSSLVGVERLGLHGPRACPAKLLPVGITPAVILPGLLHMHILRRMGGLVLRAHQPVRGDPNRHEAGRGAPDGRRAACPARTTTKSCIGASPAAGRGSGAAEMGQVFSRTSRADPGRRVSPPCEVSRSIVPRTAGRRDESCTGCREGARAGLARPGR